MCAHLPMNQLGLVIRVLLFFHRVKAQDTSDSDHSGPHFLQPHLMVVVGVLSIMFCLTFLLLAYAKFCHVAVPDFSDFDNHQQNLHGLDRERLRSSGIDKRVMESLPFFRFSSLKGSKEGLECAVCLSKFEEIEVLRLLPNCRHAFHINCIDQWLESHSSCPLCRYKFDAQDLTNFSYSNSLRFPQNPLNLAEDSTINLFVQREQDDQGSSRFSIGSSFQKAMNKGKKEEFLIQEGESSNGDYHKLWHKVNHKIIFSNMIFKNRWSDANSSDFMFLNSEMNETSPNNRFPSLESNNNGFSMNKQVVIKMQEGVDKKIVHESNFTRISRSNSVCNSTHEASTSRLLNPDLKRSMSELTNLSRFTELNTKDRVKELSFERNNAEEERTRKLWLTRAHLTVQWFAGREEIPKNQSAKKYPFNI